METNSSFKWATRSFGPCREAFAIIKFVHPWRLSDRGTFSPCRRSMNMPVAKEQSAVLNTPFIKAFWTTLSFSRSLVQGEPNTSIT